MNAAWALRLRRADAAALDHLRLRAGLAVLPIDDELWLRGPSVDDLGDAAIRAIPALRRYIVLDEGQLKPVDRQVPDGVLPQGAWVPLASAITVEEPRSSLAGRLTSRADLRLERSDTIEPVNLLMVSVKDWAAFGESASSLRLAPLAFAMDDRGRVLVRGTPLPPIPGQPFVLHKQIALPAGFRIAAGIDRADLVKLLRLEQDEIALFDVAGRSSDAAWTRLHQNHFVAAHRSAIRLSTSPEREAARG